MVLKLSVIRGHGTHANLTRDRRDVNQDAVTPVRGIGEGRNGSRRGYRAGSFGSPAHDRPEEPSEQRPRRIRTAFLICDPGYTLI